MAYSIYQSNKLENLLKMSSENFQQNDIFSSNKLFIVQSQNMALWLSYKQADQNGVYTIPDFYYPDQALRLLLSDFKILGEILQNKRLLFKDDLSLVIYNLFKQILKDKNRSSAFSGILYYIDPNLKDSTKKDFSANQEKRLYALAAETAGIFYNYSMNCLKLCQTWDQQKNVAGLSSYFAAQQRWQKELWNMIYSKESGFIHINSLLERLKKENPRYTGPVKEIIIFGSVFLSESFSEIIYQLSEQIEVKQFLFSPVKPGFTQNSKTSLPDWSILGDGFYEYFSKKECNFYSHFEPETEKNCLSTLQQALLEKKEMPKSNSDESLNMISCASSRQEIEVLKNQILYLLDHDPDLALSDIAVLAPDINEYIPYIEAVFQTAKSENQIPCNIMDMSIRSGTPYIEGFFQLLELVNSRFSRKDIMELLENPCFTHAHKLSDQDINLIQKIIKELNVFWGIDAAHKKDLQLRPDFSQTWTQALSRISYSLFFDKEDNPQLDLSENQKEKISALDMSFKDNHCAIKLINIFIQLYNDFYSLNKKERNLRDWVFLIESLCDKNINCRPGKIQDEADKKKTKRIFQQILTLLEDLSSCTFIKDASYPFSFFKRLFLDFSENSSYYKGQYLTGGICFSSLKPFRAMPFKHIFLLGMNESDFPKKSQMNNFDLSEDLDLPIKLNPRTVDQYSFLETIFSAEKSLHFFFQGHDPLSGETIHPSSILLELMEYCGFDKEKFPNQQALFSYSPLNFYKQGLLNYNKIDYQAALSLLNKKETILKTCQLNQDEKERISIDIQDLILFLRDPFKLYLQKGLGSRYPFLSDSLQDIENFSLSKKNQQYFLENYIFSKNITAEDYFINLKSEGNINKAAFWQLEKKEIKQSGDLFQEYLKTRNCFPFPPSHNLELFHFPEIEIKMTGESSVCVKLEGRTRGFFLVEEGLIYPVIQNYSKIYLNVLSDFLIQSLILKAFQIPEAENIFAFIWGNKIKPRDYSLNYSDQNYAGLLESLLKVYFDALKNPLPINAGFAFQLAEEYKKNRLDLSDNSGLFQDYLDSLSFRPMELRLAQDVFSILPQYQNPQLDFLIKKIYALLL